MYQVTHRPARRMEGRLPHGIPTGWPGSLSTVVHIFLAHGYSRTALAVSPGLLLLVRLSNRLIMRLFYIQFVSFRLKCTKNSRHAQGVHSDSNIECRLISKKRLLTLINMGADPIINSVNRWHGCHHSNQGGKIQCQ